MCSRGVTGGDYFLTPMTAASLHSLSDCSQFAFNSHSLCSLLPLVSTFHVSTMTL